MQRCNFKLEDIGSQEVIINNRPPQIIGLPPKVERDMEADVNTILVEYPGRRVQ